MSRRPKPPRTPRPSLSDIGRLDSACPYCEQPLAKRPERKTACPHCGNFIFVRSRPFDRQRVLLTEAQTFWRILLQVHRVFSEFRTAFLGKCSPVHFFWGSFDLAVTRFSGRSAPLLPDSGPLAKVMREAYSHQVSSAGFWPGGGNIDHASFYSYSYPEPKGFSSYGVRPQGTQYNKELGQFLLPYEAVRLAKNPDSMLMEFLQSTYDAAATAGNWDREALDCALGVPGKLRRVSKP